MIDDQVYIIYLLNVHHLGFMLLNCVCAIRLKVK